MKIVLAGGGTAGHIEPALNTADGLKAVDPTVEIVLLGTERGLETTLVPARGYALTLIPPVPMPRRINKSLFLFPIKFLNSIKVTRHAIQNSDVVVGFGGYVSTPAYIAAKLEGIPIVVHEANAKPGIANRVGALFAVKIVETVSGTFKRAVRLGLPLRKSISELDRAADRLAGLQNWKLADDRPTVLVFGGSQGARSLNRVIAQSADQLIADGWQILHSVGKGNPESLVSDKAHYVTVDYIPNMNLAYAIADVAVTRAGAMTVAELTAVGLPSIYVPLPIGNGEQRLNALPVVASGGGAIISDAELNSEKVVGILNGWRTAGLAEISKSAKQVGNPDATKEFVKLILEVAKA